MAIPASTRLGLYEMLATIGAGGMGQGFPAHTHTSKDSCKF